MISRCFVLLIVLGLVLFAPQTSWSQVSTRPEISESFTPTELTFTTGALLGTGLLVLWGEELVGPRSPSMGPPSAGSNDLRFSRWASSEMSPSGRWLLGGPDLAGYLVPALTLGYYAGGSLITRGSGWGGAHYHEALAFSEALTWTMFSTMLLKRIVGRERPYIVRSRLGELDEDAFSMKRSERMLSFPSGHSSAISTAMFFIAADVSDGLLTGPLAGRSTLMRATFGHALPYIVAGATSWLVMYSRIKDQRHWLSDTLTGALIGVTSALLSYHMHFNDRGEPYRR